MSVVLARLALVVAAACWLFLAGRRLVRGPRPDVSSPAHWLVLPDEAAPCRAVQPWSAPAAPAVIRLQWEPVIPACEDAARSFRFAPGYREAAWAMAATPVVSLRVELGAGATPEPAAAAEPEIVVDWSKAHHDLGQGAEIPAFWLCADEAIRLDPLDVAPELTGDAAFDPSARLGFAFDDEASALWQLAAVREHESGRAVYAS